MGINFRSIFASDFPLKVAMHSFAKFFFLNKSKRLVSFGYVKQEGKATIGLVYFWFNQW